MTNIIYDPLFLEHGDTWHPENRARLEAIIARLDASGWLDRLTPLEFAPATTEQVAWRHDEDYIHTLAQMSEAGGGSFDLDTIVTAQTSAAALLAAGGCIAAAEAACSGAAQRAICLVRPPGHHALHDRGMGFCFFNNVALAAEAALHQGLARVAIVDFDVHHGNGTQDAFYDRRDVLYISLHETPLYPGTGSLDEVGVEDGAGFNINIPIFSGAGDEHYRRAFAEVVAPALDEFRPELVLASAGYDAHHTEELARMNLSVHAFHSMVASLVGAAERHAQGRIVVVLEGGYQLQWLSWGVENTVRALEGEPPADVQDASPAPHPLQATRLQDALDHVIATHRSRLGL